MSDKKRGRHYRYMLNYHIVWIPRYRKQVLVNRVAIRLKEVLREIASTHGFEILAIEIMPDHVHLFVCAKPKHSPSEIVRLFKGASSRILNKEFSHLRKIYWGKNTSLWSQSYYVGSAGHVSSETIKGYIEESQWR